MQEVRNREGGEHTEREGRKGPPEGSRCELCGCVGPKDRMGFVSREFDADDPEFVKQTEGLPERFRPRAGRVRLAVWAHTGEC